jgi:ATP-dependent helicase HrpA
MHFSYPPELPISSSTGEIAELIKNHQVTVIAGDTGSGKTTQLPKICFEALPHISEMIGCTQPRRVAATTVADRVREELGPDRHLVGCKIRFHDQTTQATRIKFMTDGILLAETRQDPQLKKYDVIIVDEAHERSLNIDFLLGYLKNLTLTRPHLKLVITSATIDTALFSSHFDGAPVYQIQGRGYPVDVMYDDFEDQDENTPFLEQCVEVVSEVADQWPPGDILVFMPTEKDIRTSVEILRGRLPSHTILPMFGRLQYSDQQKIFKHKSGYKVVVATNVAETSVTVPGIRYVVDTGLARISSYNQRSRTTGLPVTRISQASCNQRAGRCGRTGPGTCFRLYSKEDYLSRPEYTTPEIKRSNLAEVLLQMAALHLGNPIDFPFIEPPVPSAVRDGYRILEELGAITRGRELTPDGRLMARLPIDPVISKVIIEAARNNCLKEITIIASALAIQDPKIRPSDQEAPADEAHRRFTHAHSDFMALLSIWNAFHQQSRRFSWSRLKRFSKENYLSFQRMREWLDLHDQLHLILKRHKSFTINKENGSYEQIHRSLLSGLFRQSARRKKGNVYLTDNSREIMIFPGSHQFSQSGEWIISGSYIETNRLYALTIATIEPEWIEDAARSFCSYSWTNIRWQKKTGRVIADEAVSLRNLVLFSGRIVNYGRRNKKNTPEARSVFIQKALVEGKIGSDFDFLSHNRDIFMKWQDAEDKLRKKNIVIQDDTIYCFYDKNLPAHIYDSTTLTRYFKRHSGRQLFMTQEQVLLRQPAESELLNFPAVFDIGFDQLKLTYNFKPGDQKDGVTAYIPLSYVNSLKRDLFEWLVPGLLKEQTMFLIKGLPKKLRKHFIPVSQSVDRILDNLIVYRGNYYRELSSVIFKLFKISIYRDDWPNPLPLHLQMRFTLLDHEGNELASSRDLSALGSRLNASELPAVEPSLRSQDEEFISGLKEKIHRSWDFESVPLQIPIYSNHNKHYGYLFAAIQQLPQHQGVNIIYTDSMDEATSINSLGTRYLLQLAVKDQHKLLKKHCKVSFSGPSVNWLKESCHATGNIQDLLIDFVQINIFGSRFSPIISKDGFDSKVNHIKKIDYYKSGKTLLDQVLLALRHRKELFNTIQKLEHLSKKTGSGRTVLFEELYRQLDKILPETFLYHFTEDQLQGTVRYFKSLGIRAERAYANPGKDEQKQKQIQMHLRNEESFQKKTASLDDEGKKLFSHYSHLIAEYQVSLFSPEIKTTTPVSGKKLMKAWKELSTTY